MLLTLFILASLVWLASVVQVASTRTKDPLDRVVWLLVILTLHIVGSLLYWIFADAKLAEGPESTPGSRPNRALTEDEIKERANRGDLL